MWTPGVLRIQKPELSGWVACPGAASCPRTGGHRVSRGWCRRGHHSFLLTLTQTLSCVVHAPMTTLCAHHRSVKGYKGHFPNHNSPLWKVLHTATCRPWRKIRPDWVIRET